MTAGTPAGASTTFAQLAADMAATHPDRIAFQEKRYGIWQPTTWARCWERVRDLAHGLASMGVRSGDVVAVLGDNRPEWMIAELAAQCLGACVVGIYPTSVGEEVVHVLNHGGVRVAIAEDQEQVDKLDTLWDELVTLEAVVFYDPKGMAGYDQPWLGEFTQVEAAGRAHEATVEGWLATQIAAGRGEDIAVICTTSGTTGKPKLAMLSHANLLVMGQNLMAVDELGPGDRYVSFLPFAWIGEQMLALACGLQAGFTISFCEASSTTKADLREIGPDVMFSPPRIWEDMLSSVQVRLAESGWLKRRTFAWAYGIGQRTADARTGGGAPSTGLRVQRRIADWIALRPVRDQLGLSRIRRCYTGGAPLGPDVFGFFHALGVNLKQIYGQTEICGIAVTHRDHDVRFETVGVPIPGTDMRVAEDGEILLKSPAVFQGYYGNEEATAEAVDADGWLHTGDAGYLDEGHLVVIDRAKDVLEAADGTRFSPAFIENKLKFSPYVEEAVVFYADRPHITAMLTIDAQTTGSWAEQERLGYTTYTDLAQKAEVYALLAEEVARANAGLPEAVRVRRFLVLHKQLDPDDDEITRTRKVRRNVINDRYGVIIDALYGDGDVVEVDSVVTYQDGSTTTRRIALQLATLDHDAPIAPRRLAWSGR